MKSRVVGTVTTVFLFFFTIPGIASAHGIGGRLDLPVPVTYFVVAAGIVVVVSFVALAVLWPDPRFQDGPMANRVGGSLRGPGKVVRVLSILALVLVVGQIVPALVGIDQVRGRPTIAPVLVWVVMWLMVPFGAAAIGNWYALMNPWSLLADWSGLGQAEQPDRIERLGVWPASVALLVFTWFELISPDSGSPVALGWTALIYSGYLFVAMSVWGRSTGLLVADFFTTYNRMFSAISPVGRSDDGRLVWRGWLRSLTVLPEWRGFSFFVLAAIGTVSYDGASGTTWFRDATGDLSTTTLGQTILLLAVVGAVTAAYWLAAWVAARMVGGVDTAAVARRFAHTLVPIALAYAVAHYITLILFEGQQLISAISDPFGIGWNLFGTADRAVDFFITAPEPVWYFQLVAIVTGHVLGVILAHDRALTDFGKGAVRSQYAMLLLMVSLTSLGLLILAG